MKFAALLLATTLLLQVGGPVRAEEGDDTPSSAKLIVGTIALPFRLVTGGLSGTYGFVSGGIQEAYDMSAEVNDAVVDAGTSPAQLLLWPFTISVGLVKGGVKGFSDKFSEGYNFWDEL